jgi:hypothetical protein
LNDTATNDLTDEEEDLVVKLSVLFWSAFEKTAHIANMNVHPDCYDKAVELGALANLRKNIKDLKDYPDGPNFISTRNCCVVAAVTAVDMTRKKNKDETTIYPEIYALAFQDTHHNVPIVPNGGKALGRPAVRMAKLCP